MRRWKPAGGIAIGAAALYGWVAAASAILCVMAGAWSRYRFPYCQWIFAAPYYRANWYMTVCVIVSAAVPLGLAGFLASPLIGRRLNQRTHGMPVYGRTRWASQGEMRTHDITRKQPHG